jgi:ComF family protein
VSGALGQLWLRTLGVLYPARCVGCGRFGEFMCEECLDSAPRAIGSRCGRCWMSLRKPFGGSGSRPDGTCAACDRHLPAFAGLRSAFGYEGLARSAVLTLKFQGVSALAPEMARPMVDALARWVPAVDVVVPVPLGWLRRRIRGYNQSALLAREVCRSHGLPLETRALRRARQTPPQAQQPDADARRRNIEAAFVLGPRPVGGSVLLIDDVATTGATLDACARVLLEGGASEVFGLTFERED